MKYFLIIWMVLMVRPGISQAKLAFRDGHMKQERPAAQQKAANRDKPLKGARMAKMADRLARAKMARSAFITKQLDLTPAQNEKFWPLYNKYQDELLAAQAEKRRNNLNPSADNKDKFAIEYKIIDIKAHYNAEFLKIMPPEKVNMIYKSEEQFRDELIKQLRDRKEEANN